jgi:hypothetical protein
MAVSYTFQMGKEKTRPMHRPGFSSSGRGEFSAGPVKIQPV